MGKDQPPEREGDCSLLPLQGGGQEGDGDLLDVSLEFVRLINNLFCALF